MTTPSPRRATCATCLRPQSACICRWAVPVHSPVELLILQHPLEVANAKNSARLLHLCVAGSVMEAGEVFDSERLATLLHAGGRIPLLLYPEVPVGDMPVGDMPVGDMPVREVPVREVPVRDVPVRDVPVRDMPVRDVPAAPGVAGASLLDPALLATPSRLRLVLLDATWRKSRKMLYLNPALQRLPRLALHDMPAPAYRVLRKAHAPDQLSTLEAAAHALAQLGDDGAAGTLLGAFEGFVTQQMAWRPGAR